MNVCSEIITRLLRLAGAQSNIAQMQMDFSKNHVWRSARSDGLQGNDRRVPHQLGFGPGSDRSVLPAIYSVVPMYFTLYKMLILYLERRWKILMETFARALIIDYLVPLIHSTTNSVSPSFRWA